MNKKPELLLLAGSLNRLKTAILYGADAVILWYARYVSSHKIIFFSLEDLVEV